VTAALPATAAPTAGEPETALPGRRPEHQAARMEPLDVTPRTRITRHPERQLTDRRALYEVLDAGLVAHVALVREGLPVVLPMGYARSGDALLLHGSTGGGLLREAADGAPLSVTVTLLDGLVYARSLFHSSMNYRSAMVRGTARVLHGDEQSDGLRLLSEHLMPGRWDEVRAPSARELAATMVLRLALDEVSLKVRAHGPSSSPDDGDAREVWSGVVPLTTRAGTPLAGPDVPPDVALPASVRRSLERLG
jgi:nitroimidazol reductase NimA-like FMN-containing flavoprotein (pyridoxamine 5'-phosphate oxidase superfamily)